MHLDDRPGSFPCFTTFRTSLTFSSASIYDLKSKDFPTGTRMYISEGVLAAHCLAEAKDAAPEMSVLCALGRLVPLERHWKL